jgi:glucose-1-phosphate adenylyltransferase
MEVLENNAHDDFGGDIIPAAIQSRAVYGYEFDGYWQDIGTIRAFYETNLSLARPDTPFNLYDGERPIYTHARYLPGSEVYGAALKNVLLAEGCNIGQAEIEESIVGLRSQVRDGVRLFRTILMGADYYDPPGGPLRGPLPLGIGENCQIEGAIVDKNARIGAGVIIRPFKRGVELDRGDYVVRDGIIVIPKGAVIPAGTVIAP